MVAQRQSRDASGPSGDVTDRKARASRPASIAFVALLAVASLAAIVPLEGHATLITSMPGQWCDAAKKLRYDYSSTPFSWSPVTIAGGASFYPFPERDDFTGNAHALPFTFRFFGVDYTTAQMDSNGFVGFAGDVALQANYAYSPSMPGSATPNAVAAPFWFDLTFSDPGQMMFQSFGTSQVYLWEEGQVSPWYVPSAAAAVPGYNFQLKLFSDHHLEFHYKNIYDHQGITGNPAMLGIESHYDSPNSWQGGIYRVMPNAATSSSAIKFVPVFDAAPVAASDSYSATQGSPLVVSGGSSPGALASGVLYYIRTAGVLANDMDELPCATKTAQLVTGIPAGQGTLTLGTDGGFTYNPGNFCGTTSFTYRVNDPVGTAGGSAFQSGTATVTLNVACLPNVNPTAQCSILTAAPYDVNELVQFSSSGSADSDGTIAAYEWTFTGGPALSTAANPSVSWPNPSPPSYTATLRVRDDDGAWSAPVDCPVTIEAPVVVGPNLPPEAGAKTYEVTTGTTFQTSSNYQGGLASAASDPEGSPLAFTACPPLLSGLSLQSDGHFTWPAPATPQILTFDYRASDGQLTSPCATVTLNVVPNQQPVAKFSATPNPAEVGETVSFADLSTDPDANDLIVQWSWSFGDGQLSTQGQPSHAFGTVGSFTVCLTVVDSKGASSAKHCQAIHVEPEAENPPSPPGPSAPVEQPGPGSGGDEGDDGTELKVRIDGPPTAAPGETVTLAAHVEGAPASLTWFKLHGDATMTPSGNTVSFTFPEGADSMYIGVTASSDGKTAQAAHLVSVRASEPTVEKTPDTPALEDPGLDEAAETLVGFTMRTNGNTVEVIPNVAAATFLWDFGDDSPAKESQSAIEHTYDKPGTYRITMTAGGKEYVDSAQVAAPESPAPGTDEPASASSSLPIAAIMIAAALGVAIVAVILALRRRST